MIEPTSTDLHREVLCHRPGGPTKGTIEGFNAEYVFVKLDGAAIPVRREDLDWPAKPGARPAGAPTPAAVAARSMIEAAGLTIVPIDETSWRVEVPAQTDSDQAFTFWPDSGFWKWPGGRVGGGGVRPLIAAAKAIQTAS